MNNTICYIEFPATFPTGLFCALEAAHVDEFGEPSPCMFVHEDDLDEHRARAKSAD